MNNYVNIIQDSVDTSINMGIYKNREEALIAHIFKSKLIKIGLPVFKNVENFNPNRLKDSAVKAYPINDRPRGINDIISVKLHQKQIQHNKEIMPIWMLKKNNKYILLDGAHRIVASYIEGKSNIPAYVITG